MKKFGKYEKMPNGAEPKQPAVKKALLQTYLTSLLCMVLCVAMLFGTTFAWFTSEVTNSGNEIYIGTLDVDLLKQNQDESWTSLDSAAGSTAKLFDGNVRWEPGYTAMETIKVVNEGDLAFNYDLKLTNGKINDKEDYATLLEVAKNFVVYVHAGAFTASDPKPASFADIKASAAAENGAWHAVRLGENPATLADILTRGLSVISGSMEEVRADATNPNATLPGPNDSKPTEHTYVIALHMKEDTTAEVMGHKISLNVKLTAYQRTYESDTFDNQYDANAKVPTIAPVNQTVVAYDLGNFNNVLYDGPMDVYTFDAADFQDAYPVEDYKDWLCDFYVSTDAPLDTGLMLVGHYPSFSEKWLGFYAPDSTEAYPPTPLLGTVTSGGVSNWTYYDICEIVEVFKCGLIDSESKNTGTKVTVDLRMIDPANSENVIVVTRIVVKLNAN